MYDLDYTNDDNPTEEDYLGNDEEYCERCGWDCSCKCDECGAPEEACECFMRDADSELE